MNWIDSCDSLPANGSYVLIKYEFGIGIALFVDGDWDTVGANRRHYIFTEKQKLFTSAQPPYWAALEELLNEVD